MDPFAVIALGALAGLAFALALASRPRREAAGPAEPAAADAPDDLDGLLDALNARRRPRGEADLTADGIRGARP